MNAKKMRKVMGGGVAEKGAPAQKGSSKATTQIDEKKELLRLRKEIREKKALEKRLQDLEKEA
jgi:hypothetical protein